MKIENNSQVTALTVVPAKAPTSSAPTAKTPRPDADVWQGVETKKGKQVNTGDGIDTEESVALAELATDNTQEFLKRLEEDSKNGTPVVLERKKEFPDQGTLTVRFEVNNGKMLVTAAAELSDKIVKDGLKAYAAQGAEVQPKTTIKVAFNAALSEEGNMSDIAMKASAVNIPKLSIAKLQGIEKMKERQKAILEDASLSEAEKHQKLAELLDYSIKDASKEGVGLLAAIIMDAKGVDLEGKVENIDVSIKAGKSGFDVKAKDVLKAIQAKKQEPRVDGSVDGAIEKDRDTLEVKSVGLYTSEKLALEFDAEGKSHLYRIESDGSKTELNNHAQKLMFAMPFILFVLVDKL